MISERFAWLPVRVTSGRRIWLETYYQHKLYYDQSSGCPPLKCLHFTWTETASERTMRILKESVGHNRNVWNDPKLIKENM